jgi:hypothetical protein
MNVFLTHIDWSPIIYGIALFLSVMSMAWKIKRSHYVGFFAELGVVALILMVHGGSVTGGFAATIAGLLSGWFIPLLFHKQSVSTPIKSDKPEFIEPANHTFTPYEIYLMSRK